MKKIVLTSVLLMIACAVCYSQIKDEQQFLDSLRGKFRVIEKTKIQAGSLFVDDISQVRNPTPSMLYKVTNITEKNIEYKLDSSSVGIIHREDYTIILIDSIEHIKFMVYDFNYIPIEEHKKLNSEYQTITKERIADYDKKHNEDIKRRTGELTKKFGAGNAKKIMAGEIWLGMTKAMCIESWGKPNDINRTVGSWGAHEQWVYSGSYLYFENGKLTSWQD
ncbi:MAG: hypothetical protein LBV74_00150 [Tannerella sp.]|nr:hypothetical protein [Tannerella sp.]